MPDDTEALVLHLLIACENALDFMQNMPTDSQLDAGPLKCGKTGRQIWGELRDAVHMVNGTKEPKRKARK